MDDVSILMMVRRRAVVQGRGVSSNKEWKNLVCSRLLVFFHDDN